MAHPFERLPHASTVTFIVGSPTFPLPTAHEA
jgi:hypothetical protein